MLCKENILHAASEKSQIRAVEGHCLLSLPVFPVIVGQGAAVGQFSVFT